MDKFVKTARRFAGLVITSVMMMLCLSGCGGETTEEDKLKDIEFTVVGEDQQPDSLKEIIAEKSAGQRCPKSSTLQSDTASSQAAAIVSVSMRSSRRRKRWCSTRRSSAREKRRM